MEGLKRLEDEVLKMNNRYVTIVFNFLKSKESLKESFENKEKSIKQMYKYIYEKARNFKKDNVAVIEDNVVYLWAMTYFKKSNKELGIEEKKVMPPSAKEVIRKIEEKEKEEKKDEQTSLFEEVQK